METPDNPQLPSPTPLPATVAIPYIALETILSGISHVTRWQMLNLIHQMGEPLSISDFADHLKIQKANATKHLAVLCKSGVVRKGRGKLYGIPPYFLVPGQRALDLGAVVLRLDRVDAV